MSDSTIGETRPARDLIAVDVDVSDAAFSPFADDLWRAVLRPVIHEMYYSRVCAVKIIRYDRLKCRLEFEIEEGG